MSRIELITNTGFDTIKAAEVFQARGWKTELVRVGNVNLVPTSEGAAIECGDGRELQGRALHGPKMFGGVNGVAALSEGGTLNAWIRASIRCKELGFNPGTHGDASDGEGGCGFYLLWKNNKLTTVPHKWDMGQRRSGLTADEMQELEAARRIRLPETIGNRTIEDWKDLLKAMGGKHMKVNGSHQETALRINPFIRLTEDNPLHDRFLKDDWFANAMGIDLETRCNVAAETIELLKPDAKRVEILIP